MNPNAKGSRKSTALTPEQYQFIAQTYLTEQNWPMLCICVLMGQRGLRVSDVTRNISVNDIYELGGQIKENLALREIKTKKQRVIPICGNSEIIKTAFENYYQTILHCANRENGLFACIPFTRPWTDSKIKKELERFKGFEGINQISPHSFRKFCGRTMNKNGFSVETISQFFGHSNTTVTMIYLDIVQADTMAAITSLDKF